MLIATAVGVQLQFPVTQNGVPVSLQNASPVTITLIDPNNNRTSVTATVGSTTLTLPDGSTVAANFWAFITTTSTMFPIAGTYQAQLVANISANTFYSDPFNIFVGRKL